MNFLSKHEKLSLIRVKKQEPVVCCLTNIVTANDCANIVLAFGGKPIMTTDKQDVYEILTFSKALVLNIGTIKEDEIELFIIAGQYANKQGIPIVLDPCGMQATDFRFDVIEQLLSKVHFSVIKCNSSEIYALYKVCKKLSRTSKCKTDNIEQMARFVAKKYGCIICVSGKIDIITDGIDTKFCKYGNQIMKSITGCGCMLACVIACFCGVGIDCFSASYLSCCIYGKKYKTLLKKQISGAKTFCKLV